MIKSKVFWIGLDKCFCDSRDECDCAYTVFDEAPKLLKKEGISSKSFMSEVLEIEQYEWEMGGQKPWQAQTVKKVQLVETKADKGVVYLMREHEYADIGVFMKEPIFTTKGTVRKDVGNAVLRLCPEVFDETMGFLPAPQEVFKMKLKEVK